MKLLEVNYDEMTDVELVKAFSKGDSNAIGVIFSRYTGFLKSKAASFDCCYYNEDLMQEGKIGLFKAVLHFDEDFADIFSHDADGYQYQ